MSVNISQATYNKIRGFIENDELHLTCGAIKDIFENDGELRSPAVLQLTNFKMSESENGAPGTCARAKMFDGTHFYKFFFFSSDVANQLRRDNLIGKYDGAHGGEVLLLTKTKFSLANKTKTGSAVLIIEEYELLSRGHPCLDAKGIEHMGTPEAIELFRGFKPSKTCSISWKGQVMAGPTVPNMRAAAPPTKLSAPPPRMPPRSNLAFGGGNITPITAITPYLNKWKIRGICTSTEGLKDINTARGPSKVFNFILTDKDGSSIRIAAFGDTAETTAQLVQQDCSYYLSGGQVKQTNKRFNTTGHDYEISLRNDSEISPCSEFITRPAFSLKICPLDRIVNHKDETVDVLAVVDKMEPVTDFTSRAGKEMTKRDITLVDQTCTVVQFTLWNDQARTFEEEALGQVIGIKGASVKEFNGGVSLSCIGGTKWELTPQLEEVAPLYEWFMNTRPNAETKTLTATSTAGDSLSRDLRLVGTFNALQLGNEPDLPNGRYMSVKARISSVKNDTALYQACSNENCQKKVIPLDNQYRCEKCNTTSDTFKWQYLVQIELADATGTFWIRIFSKTAEKLFGKNAQEMGELKEYDSDGYAKVFNDARSRCYMWRIRAKPETYNEELRMQYSVFDVQEVNWEKYIAELKRTITTLDQLYPS